MFDLFWPVVLLILVVAILSVAIGWLLYRSGTLEGRFGNLEHRFDALEGKLTNFMTDVRQLFQRASPTLESASPLTLNELGKRIAKDLQAYQWASDLAPSLKPRVSGKEPFEIDDFCLQYTRSELDPSWISRIAASAFQHGVDHAAVEDVLRVVLRDKLLELLRLSTP